MRRSHVLITLTAIIALLFALPAVGATSPLKTAKAALGLAKKANKSAASAKTSAAAARISATAADKKAQSALDALGKPVGSAINAQNAATAQNAANAQNAQNAANATRATSAGSVDNLVVLANKRVPVSGSGATVAAARSAAAEVPLFTRGPISIYAKCFKNTASARVYQEVYGRSTVDGATMASDGSDQSGGATADFLNVDTLETNATIDDSNVLDNSSDTGYPDNGQFQILAPNGSFVDGYISSGVKQGTLPGGNGPFLAGDGCMFNGVLNLG